MSYGDYYQPPLRETYRTLTLPQYSPVSPPSWSPPQKQPLLPTPATSSTHSTLSRSISNPASGTNRKRNSSVHDNDYQPAEKSNPSDSNAWMTLEQSRSFDNGRGSSFEQNTSRGGIGETASSQLKKVRRGHVRLSRDQEHKQKKNVDLDDHEHHCHWRDRYNNLVTKQSGEADPTNQQEQIKTLEKKCQQLEADKAALKRRLGNKSGHDCEKVCSELRKEKAFLSAKLKESEKSAETWVAQQNDIEQLENRCDTIEYELRKSEKQCEVLKSEKESAEEKVEKLKNKFRSQHGKIAQLEQQYQSVEEQLTQAKLYQSQLEDECSAEKQKSEKLESDCQVAKEELNESKKECSAVNQKYDRVQLECERVKEEFNQTKIYANGLLLQLDELNQLKDVCAAHETNIKELNDRIKAYSVKLVQSQNEVKELNSTFADWKSKHDALFLRQTSETDAAIEALKSKDDQLKLECEKRLKEVKNLKTNLSDLQRIQAERDRVQNEVNQLTAKCGQLEKKVNDLQKKLKSKMSKVEQLKTTINESNEKHNTVLVKQHQETSKLQEDLRLKTAEVQERICQCSKFENQIEELKKELKAKESTVQQGLKGPYCTPTGEKLYTQADMEKVVRQKDEAHRNALRKQQKEHERDICLVVESRRLIEEEAGKLRTQNLSLRDLLDEKRAQQSCIKTEADYS